MSDRLSVRYDLMEDAWCDFTETGVEVVDMHTSPATFRAICATFYGAHGNASAYRARVLDESAWERWVSDKERSGVQFNGGKITADASIPDGEMQFWSTGTSARLLGSRRIIK